jgi:hypothetical protein
VTTTDTSTGATAPAPPVEPVDQKKRGDQNQSGNHNGNNHGGSAVGQQPAGADTTPSCMSGCPEDPPAQPTPSE